MLNPLDSKKTKLLRTQTVDFSINNKQFLSNYFKISEDNNACSFYSNIQVLSIQFYYFAYPKDWTHVTYFCDRIKELDYQNQIWLMLGQNWENVTGKEAMQKLQKLALKVLYHM